MSSVIDPEFGEITVRRTAGARYVRIRVAPNGRLKASLPMYAPLYMVKRLLKTSRDEIRDLLREHRDDQVYTPGMQIGKSHTLLLGHPSGTTNVTKDGLQISIHLAADDTVEDDATQALIREKVIEALRREAKSYLPKRLAQLAKQHSYQYDRVRFSHAGSRWGSCSTSGTISLNIALMKLPFELIEYVLVHELAHTIEMNHSQAFWQRVEAADPHYLAHRRALKSHTTAL